MLDASVARCVVAGFLIGAAVAAQSAKTFIPVADATAILQLLRDDLIPPDLAGVTPDRLTATWPQWVKARDAAIRARVEAGDEDAIVHLLLFGTTFTRRPRAGDADLAALAAQPAQGQAALGPRMDEFVGALASPGSNERLQFARELLERRGFEAATAAGRTRIRRHLEDRTVAMIRSGAVRSSTLLDPGADLADKLTLFRERGLSSDTSIFIGLGVDEALESVRSERENDGPLRTGTVRRVAIVGPGLDFTDKLEGYDFYPQQTIQPFALIDSLLRYGLAVDGELAVTAFDLSPRVLQHLEAARQRAKAGMPYGIVLPRNPDRPWSPALADYWQRAGNYVGTNSAATTPPGAGRVTVRRVEVRPSIVLSIETKDLNVVTERLEPLAADQQFDLLVATNILLYYGVFEQSLAAANMAAMLKPGGVLLTNNRIFELPAVPLAGVGFTDSVYMSIAGVGTTGDRLIRYQKGGP
jgi:hypothetical protein